MATMQLIVNPAAGRGQAAKIAPDAARILEGLGVSFEVRRTTQPGEATLLAEQAALAGCPAVVALGGDGTVNEVLNGLVRAQANGGPVGTLGVIPAGSGNDFEYMLERTDGLASACRRLAEGQAHAVDVGRVNDRYFANGVGIGFDAVVNVVSRRHRRLRGLPLYLLAVLETVFIYYKAPRITVRYDQVETTAPMLMISVTNGRRFGGGFLVTPQAELDDGLLDLCLAHQVSQLGILRLIPHFIRGTHIDKPAVKMARARKVVVTSDDGLASHVDGEIYTTDAKRLEIEILPRHLNVIG
jgi:diacylglycerol kinase (ATP)